MLGEGDHLKWVTSPSISSNASTHAGSWIKISDSTCQSQLLCRGQKAGQRSAVRGFSPSGGEALLRMDVCRLKQECRHHKETKSSASWHEPESLKCESPLGEKSKRLLFFKVCSSLNTHLQNNLFSNFAHFLSEKFLLFYNSLFCRYLFVPKFKLLGPLNQQLESSQSLG